MVVLKNVISKKLNGTDLLADILEYLGLTSYQEALSGLSQFISVVQL